MVSICKSLRKVLPIFQLLWTYYNANWCTTGKKVINMKIFIELPNLTFYLTQKLGAREQNGFRLFSTLKKKIRKLKWSFSNTQLKPSNYEIQLTNKLATDDNSITTLCLYGSKRKGIGSSIMCIYFLTFFSLSLSLNEHIFLRRFQKWIINTCHKWIFTEKKVTS